MGFRLNGIKRPQRTTLPNRCLAVSVAHWILHRSEWNWSHTKAILSAAKR